MIKRLHNYVSQSSVATLLAVIAWYQRWLSPLLGNNCRFHPTCSHYAQQALRQHGALQGSLLACARICRCQPLCKGGVDMPPRSFSLAALFNLSRNDSEIHNGSQT